VIVSLPGLPEIHEERKALPSLSASNTDHILASMGFNDLDLVQAWRFGEGIFYDRANIFMTP
jgi:hypothetical protein